MSNSISTITPWFNPFSAAVPALRVLRPVTPLGFLARAVTVVALLAAPGCTELHVHDAPGGETGGFDDEAGVSASADEGADEGASESGASGSAGEDAGTSTGDDTGTSDGTGDASEPFERFIAYTAATNGGVVELLPGPETQALFPDALTVNLFLPNPGEGPLVVEALDADRNALFRVEVEDDIELMGGEGLGSKVGMVDGRLTPIPPNCTFPPCPGEDPDADYVVTYARDGYNWTVGQVADVLFGHGVREVDGELEVVPFEGGREPTEVGYEKMYLAEKLLDDANEFLSLDNSTVPPEMAGIWEGLCTLGKWGLKGAITVAQGSCCTTPILAMGGGCVACAAVGEAGKDVVDKIPCGGKN